ncbi:MAG: L-seryl-tRNA(Sec) selenium transferase [Syntrophales bacterium]|nr:L-seryl-tRNA(Sec) selenium transferase [Syntrophales bacterium]
MNMKGEKGGEEQAGEKERNSMDERKKALLSSLPSIDELLVLLEKKGIYEKAPREIVKATCRQVVEDLRHTIMKTGGEEISIRLPVAKQVADKVTEIIEVLHQYRLRRVVNATGTILHTNLGRAPLCREALERVLEVGGGYSNLEFDLARGQRGLRYDHIQSILCALSGAEDALIVNNNAAAVLLILNTLAEGKEVIVSRGELIEIGGEFRIPEVMAKSGAHLREVGTTNRTRISDYENAIGENTGLILKVHTSNFKMMGFTEDTGLASLVALGEKRGVPVMEDLGSGCFLELDHYGLEREPTVSDVMETGVDVVSFSGDKLLGGPQAGIILGKRELLQRIKKNPLNRVVRIDKLTLAALEATMIQYLRPEKAACRLRVLKTLTEPLTDVTKRAKRLLAMLRRARLKGLVLSLKKGFSMAGGGSLPTCEIPTMLLAVQPGCMSANSLEERLRCLDVPIIARVAEEQVLFDLRTVEEEEFAFIRDGLKHAVST